MVITGYFYEYYTYIIQVPTSHEIREGGRYTKLNDQPDKLVHTQHYKCIKYLRIVNVEKFDEILLNTFNTFKSSSTQSSVFVYCSQKFALLSQDKSLSLTTTLRFTVITFNLINSCTNFWLEKYFIKCV